MRRRVLWVALLLMTSTPAWSQRLPIWEASIEQRDVWLVSAVAKGKLVFVSGSEMIDQDQRIERGILAALDVNTGEPAWIVEGDPATGHVGGARWESKLGPLALAKRVVVTGGFREVLGPGWEGIVRAYDQKTGTLLWSKQFPDGSLTQVAVRGKTVYAATTMDYGSSDPWILLVAYDLLTGTELWSTSHGPLPEDPKVHALAAGGKFVAVVGSQTGTGPSDADLLVRAYDAKSGAFLWDDVFDQAQGVDAGYTAAIRGKRLFVGGTQEPQGGDQDSLLRTYDLKGGTLLWSQSMARQGYERVTALVATGSLVVTLILEDINSGWLVRAHQAKNGVARWDTAISESPTFVTSCIAAEGRRIVVGLDTGTHAFDSKTGAPVWDATRGGFSAAIRGKTVVVPGIGGAAAYLVK